MRRFVRFLTGADRRERARRESEEQFVRSMVSRYARGNASLKLGRYVTADEMKARREALAKWTF